MQSPFRIFCVLSLFLILVQGKIFAQSFSYTNEPLLSVISDIETQTKYRFLYREALISDIRISFEADKTSLMNRLSGKLKEKNIGLRVDEARNQALVYAASALQEDKRISISGYVLDALTGERLPYATISWRDKGKLEGISSNPSGAFQINLNSESEYITFLFSFVGYEPIQISLDFKEVQIWKDISVRLKPQPLSGKEILVQGVNTYTASDSVLKGLIKVGTFSPLGESNAVRSLQMLPSVTMSSAINDGINIRGSSSDGFQILLDGQTVYHQSHLFGLLDAMNPDVLKTSGFFYDITPAQYQAPLGGTLSLITRTGSLNEIKGSAGFSNTAVKTTIEGPIRKSKSSWLISGRISYLDEISWLNNQDLIEYGLDVNRPADIIIDQPLNPNIQDIKLDQVEIENTDARFYDLHGKVYFETKNGSQFAISSYFGHDNASQDYYRNQSNNSTLFVTNNEWDTESISASFNSNISKNIYSSSSVGISMYSSLYEKGDFEYQVRKNNQSQNRDSSLIAPLELQNSLSEFDINQSFISSFESLSMEYGINYSDYDVEYTENSLDRTSFKSRRNSQLMDLFHQIDISSIEGVRIHIGNRLHYFSNGKYTRWSPRLKAQFFEDKPISFGAGYSRNYQFLHRLQFYNINSSDFWILSNEEQPPSYVDYYSGSLKIRPFDHTYFQIEGYIKDYGNLRLHELNTSLVSDSFKNNGSPWFYENSGIGRGMEFLMKNRIRKVTLSSAYTLSSMEIRNNRINNGEYFYADWDRRHQFSFVSEIDLQNGFELFLAWTFGSGAPNRLDLQKVEQETRLPSYSRVDATFSYSRSLKSNSLKTSFSLYNMLNRDNPWYTEIKQISVQARNRNVQTSARTNVYDLGIQPSFNIGFYF